MDVVLQFVQVHAGGHEPRIFDDHGNDNSPGDMYADGQNVLTIDRRGREQLPSGPAHYARHRNPHASKETI